METTINLNDTVRVKLTDAGRKVHRAEYDQLIKDVPAYKAPYVLPEDADGYSNWQLWCLMRTFGPHIYMGGPNMFDMTIVIKK